MYQISDKSSIKIDEKISSTFAGVGGGFSTDFFISANTKDHLQVILLRIPEDNIGYATDLVNQLQATFSTGQTVVFERNEFGKTLFLILVSLAFSVLVGFGFFKKETLKSPEDSDKFYIR